MEEGVSTQYKGETNVVYRWFQDKKKGTGPRDVLPWDSLGQETIVFQVEVYTIKACAAEYLDRNYKNRNIYILSDSQAVIKALGKYQINSKLVWDCHQCLIHLARHNRVQVIWVPGHEGTAGNETADLLART
jgi:hypothetical protein